MPKPPTAAPKSYNTMGFSIFSLFGCGLSMFLLFFGKIVMFDLPEIHFYLRLKINFLPLFNTSICQSFFLSFHLLNLDFYGAIQVIFHIFNFIPLAKHLISSSYLLSFQSKFEPIFFSLRFLSLKIAKTINFYKKVTIMVLFYL